MPGAGALEAIRATAPAHGADQTPERSRPRQHTPKIAFVARLRATRPPAANAIGRQDVDLLVRALSMGQLHHAMMGTAAVAIGTAAAIPGTLVNLAAGGACAAACGLATLGHLRVGGGQTQLVNGQWKVTKALMSRSARILMEGWVRVPAR